MMTQQAQGALRRGKMNFSLYAILSFSLPTLICLSAFQSSSNTPRMYASASFAITSTESSQLFNPGVRVSGEDLYGPGVFPCQLG